MPYQDYPLFACFLCYLDMLLGIVRLLLVPSQSAEMS